MGLLKSIGNALSSTFDVVKDVVTSDTFKSLGSSVKGLVESFKKGEDGKIDWKGIIGAAKSVFKSAKPIVTTIGDVIKDIKDADSIKDFVQNSEVLKDLLAQLKEGRSPEQAVASASANVSASEAGNKDKWWSSLFSSLFGKANADEGNTILNQVLSELA